MYKCKYCDYETENCKSIGGHIVQHHNTKPNSSTARKAKKIELYNSSPVFCQTCGKKLDYDIAKAGRKFCNHSCSATYSNINRKREYNPCLFCGEKIVGKGKNYKFCSSLCCTNYRRKTNEDLIESGETSLSSSFVKSYLLKKNSRKCDSCNLSEWMGKDIVLELHHKDGNCNNNGLGNVCLLCPNCHSLTDTYKAKNKGGGRHTRKERYRDGKSY